MKAVRLTGILSKTPHAKPSTMIRATSPTRLKPRAEKADALEFDLFDQVQMRMKLNIPTISQANSSIRNEEATVVSHTAERNEISLTAKPVN